MNDELKIKNNELGGKMNYRYRNDEEMKDSGVEWIGKIPKEWSISRISKEFIIRNEKVSDKDFAPLSVTKQGILPQLDSVAKSDNGDNRKRVCVGDFVINSRADRKGSCGTSSYDGSVSLICNVLTPNYLDSQYIHSLFRNYYFSEEFYRWGSGIVDDLWSTNIEKMKKINIPKPNKNEDKKIAKFLDKKIAQFDFIISKKEALIEKLEEAKKSLISEVVTGKVKVVKTNDGYELVERKKEEMKDSGVEWLGDIPKEWIRKKLKYNCYIKGRIGWQGLKQSEFIDEGPYLITGMNFKNGVINWSEVYHISEERYQEAPEIHLKLGDVLITKDGTIGKLLFIDYLPGKASLNSHLLVMRPLNNDFLPKFLYYSLDASYFKEYVEQVKTGTTFFGITQESISNFNLLIPSLDEQKIVIEYLDERLKILNEIIYKVKYEITKIKEAKKSLISEAVTGKIEILD